MKEYVTSQKLPENRTFRYPSIAVLGSTGSVGKQAMDVARKKKIPVHAVCADRSVGEIENQVREFHIPFCAMRGEEAARELRIALSDTDTKVYSGEDGILEMIRACGAETVVNSLSGKAGLFPTLETIRAGKKLALANKESLVIAGNIVMQEAREHHTEILPVDSEHCAIFQSLRAGKNSEIKKIILTASGGPFFGFTKDQLARVTISDTLAHPTWNMGGKITVDSATLMNKGYEVIEAVHLFGVRPEQIQVTVHRESIIHSAVEYIDNSIIAQLAVPDMRACVQYALTHPDRTPASVAELDLFEVGKLTFARPDTGTFPLLSLAERAIREGGALPAVVNAADEVAVGAFLTGKLSFPAISETVLTVADRLSDARKVSSLDDILAYDRTARDMTASLIQ